MASSFHNDIFNRRSGFFDTSSMVPKPLFSDNQERCRSTSFSETTTCIGSHHGCHCHTCSCSSSNEGYRQRTEETCTDSSFNNGCVRARSSTTMCGDASFGFANMESEMTNWAKDNRWRGPGFDSFYGRPFDNSDNCVPVGHMRLREDNFGEVFDNSHQRVHGGRLGHMHAEAHAFFNNTPRPSEGYREKAEEEDTKVVKTTTTTTTTTTTCKHCSGDCCCGEEKPVPCLPPPPCPPTPPPAPPSPSPPVIIIPIGTKPDVPVKPAEPCCTWCKFLPCFSCPKPPNPNNRFHKLNFRLYPEYEFLQDDVEAPKPTEWFPEHTHDATRSEFKLEIPKITETAHRVYVDFIGDQVLVVGEHGHPKKPSHETLDEKSRHLHHGSASSLPLGVMRVFAKNFFVPRDTYGRDHAQVFIKPNGKLKLVVPAIQ